MTETGLTVFRRLDRAFWLVWLAFPLMLWAVVRSISTVAPVPEGLSPEARACFEIAPQVAAFSPAGRRIVWAMLGIEVLFYAALLFLAHRVIHRCATGRVFMAEMIGALHTMGLMIVLWPPFDLLIGNLAVARLASLGDLWAYQPDFALDVPVMGVGILMLAIAVAMREAARLREDSELTI